MGFRHRSQYYHYESPDSTLFHYPNDVMMAEYRTRSAWITPVTSRACDPNQVRNGFRTSTPGWRHTPQAQHIAPDYGHAGQAAGSVVNGYMFP